MNSITVNIRGLDELQKRLKSAQVKMVRDIDESLSVSAEDIATKAKQLAPVDEGNLRGSISADNSRLLEKHISVNSFYAAFVEFGSGKYAAAYVASLPAEWQQYAATFRGQKGGTLDEMIRAVTEWVHRKGIVGTFSIKTQRRRKPGKAEIERLKQAAYLIVKNILRNGIHAHPFLFPAFEEQRPIIIKNVNTILSGL